MGDLPSQERVEAALLAQLQEHLEPLASMEVYDLLADRFGLTDVERARMLPDGSEPHWRNRVRQARRHLAQIGFVESADHGVWALTASGRLATLENL